MRMTTHQNTSAKILSFPLRGALGSPKKWGKRHLSLGKTFSIDEVSAFLHTLIHSNVQGAQQLMNELGSELATVHGNYFCLPLLIAANNHNMALINLLLENGACLHSALQDARFQYIHPKMRSYLKNMLRFRQHIEDSI